MTHTCCQDQRGWRKSCTILYTQKIGHYEILRFLCDARSGTIASANYKLTGPEDHKTGGAEDQSSRTRAPKLPGSWERALTLALRSSFSKLLTHVKVSDA